ncbi:MAG: hypothetical protein L3J74_02785 [Bacteroidales bacterium]|nr:hypothetical protein [Bacteroidales bacterium]
MKINKLIAIIILGLFFGSSGNAIAQKAPKIALISNHTYILTYISPAGKEYIAFANNDFVSVNSETVLNTPEAVVYIKRDSIESTNTYTIYFVNTDEYLYNGFVKVSKSQHDKYFAKDANNRFVKPKEYRQLFYTKIRTYPNGQISLGNIPGKFKLYLLKE